MFVMKKLALCTIILINSLIVANASENQINKLWCSKNGGEEQFRTKDRTFVDCITEKYAIEAEYDYNWKEAIGQSLHYAESTNKKAGILFIIRAKSNKDYYGELMRVIKRFQLPITVFVINE